METGIFFLKILLTISNIPSITGRYTESFHRTGTQCIAHENCGLENLCQDGFCACALNQTYDKIQKTCATLVGSDCSNIYSCVSNAHCDKLSRKCSCNLDQFSKTSFGECRLNYGADCGKRGIYCNPEKFLRCNIGWNRCTCANDNEQIYDNVSGTCLARPGERCELFGYGISPPCVSNASCVPDSTDFGKCICSEGFKTIDSSSCLPLYGSPCDVLNGCAPGRNLQCLPSREVATTCTCGSGTTFNPNSTACERGPLGSCSNDAIYDPKSGLCRIKVSQTCEEENSDLCVRHAVCENGICRCTINYVGSESGQCQLSYGSRCISNNLGGSPECKQETFLRCILEKCQCPLGEIFDENMGSCVRLVCTPCDIVKDRCIGDSRCTELPNGNAVCKYRTTECEVEVGTQQVIGGASSTPHNSGFNDYSSSGVAFRFLLTIGGLLNTLNNKLLNY